MVKTILLYYSYLYNKINNAEGVLIDFDTKSYNTAKNLLERFKIHYNGSIDENFLWDYIVFQFEYYSNLNTRFGKGKIPLNWLTGEKAVNRWTNKRENWKYWSDKFCAKNAINKPTIFIENGEGKRHREEIERRRFYQTERGLLHCIELDLYNKSSKECKECKWKCKNV